MEVPPTGQPTVVEAAEPAVPVAAVSPPEFQAKAKDLGALRDAVVDAAGVSVGLWVSYLFVLFYLLVAAGSVNHRDLFFESPVKLPFLNVDLPLLGFFWLGPAIFLVVHMYILLHFVLLSAKVGAFDAELRAQIDDETARAQLRRQLPSNVFVQFLAGPADVRNGAIGFLLRVIAWISLVIGPIALLAFFDLQFLPYHHDAITWWHRIAVILDLVMLWVLWPAILRGKPIRASWKTLAPGDAATMGTVTLLAVSLTVVFAPLPDEQVQRISDYDWINRVRKMLVAGDVDLAARRPSSLWSNRLVLPDLDTTKRAGSEAAPALSLRTRDLRGAVLIGATLASVDFTAADLRGAQLDFADLRHAKMSCDLKSLERSTLEFRKLEAIGTCTRLQSASLAGAKLQGASLSNAQLQGAVLDEAKLNGAWMEMAKLRGASLQGADLRGANLGHADLRGAALEGANLQGASMRSSNLSGALLSSANLQGAVLRQADFSGAMLTYVRVWRADATGAVFTGAQVGSVIFGPKVPCASNRHDDCDWSPQAFRNLRGQSETLNLAEARQQDILDRLDRLNPALPLPKETEIEGQWGRATDKPVADGVYEANLIKAWSDFACDKEDTTAVLEGLVHHSRNTIIFSGNKRLKKALAKIPIDRHCPDAVDKSPMLLFQLRGYLNLGD